MNETKASREFPEKVNPYAEETAAIGDRIDNLPNSKKLWMMVILIAVGGFFEVYDLALATPLAPGLVAAGVFRAGSAGIFGMSDQATFIAATFLGLYLGIVAFSAIGNRVGRKTIFTYSLIWYSVATVIMGLQSDAISICIWRFIAGIALGAESMAIDCYTVELVPKHLRGRAFGISKSVAYTSVPVCLLLAATLIPISPMDVPGWRWLTFFPVFAAIAFWVIRRDLPESPLWLASRGRIEEANAILDGLDGGESVTHKKSPSNSMSQTDWAPPSNYMFRVTVMMVIFFSLHTIFYYGFQNWIPTLIESQGVSLKKSLVYTFGIAISMPLAPLLFGFVSDRFERKYQLIFWGMVSIALGLLFGNANTPTGWIGFGVALTFANAIMSFNSHCYQSEIFPTSVRAQAVGFVYSFTRLASAISGYCVAFVLARGGVNGVFVALGIVLFLALATLAVLGPKTNNRSFKQITGME